MKKKLEIDPQRIKEWEQAYSPLNVAQEIEKMQLWLTANPRRAARKKNWHRFIINWLNKAHAQVVVAQVQSRMAVRVGAYDPKKTGLWVDGVKIV